MIKQLLTHSRQDSFKTCRKKHYFSYELGIRRVTDAKALRMGTAHHDAIEMLGNGFSLDDAVAAVRQCYEDRPHFIDEYEWAIECETVVRIACAYQWRWQNDGLKYHAAERKFRIPLINPQTGARSKLFDLAGMIDGIVEQDGRLLVKESKLLGDDIGPDADLWRRMRIEHQISLYIHAARQLGFPVDAVLYDVTRKPTIKPTPIPVVDELGIKIVVDANGERVKTKTNLWRQTASKDDGYILLTRPMTVEEWGEKLTEDIVSRPDFYFARVEIPRLDQDIAEYQAELWEIQKTLREAQNNNQWFRTVNKNTCTWCDYFNICTNGYKAGGTLPEGFEYVSVKHPELGDMDNDPSSTTATEETCATATSSQAERAGIVPGDDPIF